MKIEQMVWVRTHFLFYTILWVVLTLGFSFTNLQLCLLSFVFFFMPFSFCHWRLSSQNKKKKTKSISSFVCPTFCVFGFNTSLLMYFSSFCFEILNQRHHIINDIMGAYINFIFHIEKKAKQYSQHKNIWCLTFMAFYVKRSVFFGPDHKTIFDAERYSFARKTEKVVNIQYIYRHTNAQPHT